MAAAAGAVAGASPSNEEPASLFDVYNVNIVPSELFLKFRKELEGFRVGINFEFYNFESNDYQAKLVLKPRNSDPRWKFVYEPLHGDVRLFSKKFSLTKYLNLQVIVDGKNTWKFKMDLFSESTTRIEYLCLYQITNGKIYQENPPCKNPVFCLHDAVSVLPAVLGKRDIFRVSFLKSYAWWDSLICISPSMGMVGIGHNFQCNATGWNWKLSTCLGGDGVSHFRNKTSINFFPGFDLRIGWKAEYILPSVQGAIGTEEPIVSLNYGRLQASLDRVEAIITT